MSGEITKSPSTAKLAKIRIIAGQLLGKDGYDVLLAELGGTIDSDAEAATVLGALHKVKNGLKPLAGAETTVFGIIASIREATYTPDAPKPESAIESPTPPTDSASGPSRRCASCGLTKPITEYTRKGKGHRKICKPCVEGIIITSPTTIEDDVAETRDGPIRVRGGALVPVSMTDQIRTYVEDDLHIMEIPLESGGAISVTIRVNLFELVGADRTFVLDFIDHLRGYQR